jgi:hypothetical protein
MGGGGGGGVDKKNEKNYKKKIQKWPKIHCVFSWVWLGGGGGGGAQGFIIIHYLKGTQAWDILGLRFWIIYFFVVTYA